MLSVLSWLLGGTTLAFGALATYYRIKLSALNKGLDTAALERNALAAQNRAWRDRVVAAEKALAARQAKEAKEDAVTAEGARGNADRAVELLRSLNGSGRPAKPAL